MNDSPNLPASLTVNPRLDRWIKFEDDRTVPVSYTHLTLPTICSV